MHYKIHYGDKAGSYILSATWNEMVDDLRDALKNHKKVMVEEVA